MGGSGNRLPACLPPSPTTLPCFPLLTASPPSLLYSFWAGACPLTCNYGICVAAGMAAAFLTPLYTCRLFGLPPASPPSSLSLPLSPHGISCDMPVPFPASASGGGSLLHLLLISLILQEGQGRQWEVKVGGYMTDSVITLLPSHLPSKHPPSAAHSLHENAHTHILPAFKASQTLLYIDDDGRGEGNALTSDDDNDDKQGWAGNHACICIYVPPSHPLQAKSIWHALFMLYMCLGNLHTCTHT